MPEQQQPRPQLRGNQCNMADIMQRISLSKPPVNEGMYRTLYMMDYKPYADYHYQPPTMDASQKLKLEAQLKAKEFERPVEHEPVKYVEGPGCQEVQPPYPTRMDGRLSKGQEASPFLPFQEDQRNYYLPLEPVAVQQMEGEKLPQQTDSCTMPGNIETPCIMQELGQNWNNYQQFLLEKRRANQMQLKEIKKMHLGSSVFSPDFITSTNASTYQRDYKYWPRVQSGYCRANRNFSNLHFEDGYYIENPWTSEYMDNYNIFLRKLNWKTRNPVSSFCSAIKPIPRLSHGMSSQTPIAVNTAP
ncbi:uncharacterized protein LOC133367135 [Rhineura floridana]|uniref:uncharacterized protein LOC133367135 n=1 Tax=Rhineura floridana TaxID=261503 RepID=UPI002AC85369|nr:uncharacterized protein LOC133367135 [Rhineura floridana]